MENKECIYYNITDTGAKTLVSSVDIKKYPTNFYIYSLRIANIDSSDTTVSVYAGRRVSDQNVKHKNAFKIDKDLGDSPVYQDTQRDSDEFTETEEINNYIIKDVVIPVGTSLVLEKDDLYIQLGRNLKMTSSQRVDVSVELHNTKTINKRLKSNYNTY